MTALKVENFACSNATCCVDGVKIGVFVVILFIVFVVFSTHYLRKMRGKTGPIKYTYLEPRMYDGVNLFSNLFFIE